ncbi:MFS transporter [Saccharomonospora sp. CUA-673]|uniref:MFS transporter n=1 Tax=Saccharomonospora sp. CUA-673 TaxID=1904969 RepID=UPI001C9E5B0C|nr:MFS transporter [Saccharomonospora sp. CUA-673]
MTAEHTSPGSTARASARTWAGLPILLLPTLLVAMDISILFVAGPAVARDLAPNATQWLWMMDIYSFVMAGLLLTMGAVGDRIGRRRLLLIGTVVFGIGSAGLAFAPSPEVFIAARVLLGVGAATLAPSTLGLIRAMFHDPDQRRAAVGAWTAAFAGGAVAGPVFGGLLLEHFWWGSVFLINIPVMALLLATRPCCCPNHATPTPADSTCSARCCRSPASCPSSTPANGSPNTAPTASHSPPSAPASPSP